MVKNYDKQFLCLYTSKNKNQMKSCVSGTGEEISSILRKILKRYPSKEKPSVYWNVLA